MIRITTNKKEPQKSTENENLNDLSIYVDFILFFKAVMSQPLQIDYITSHLIFVLLHVLIVLRMYSKVFLLRTFYLF